MQKKTINTTLEKSINNKLSIQFTLDGFSFCITNLDAKKTIHFCSYIFNQKLKSPENLVVEIETIFKQNTYLQEDFKEILVIHQNNLSTFVPDEFFNEKNLKEYLSYTIKTLATDFFAYDSVLNAKIKNIYVPFVNVNNYIFQNFGAFEYMHSTTILTEKLIEKNTITEKTMFVDVSIDEFSIVILENKNLLFSNSFSYKTKEDFIYYVLFTAEQLNLDTNKFQLFFTGTIQKESEIYKIAYQYIRNIAFLESKNEIFKNSDFLNHTNFILLG